MPHNVWLSRWLYERRIADDAWVVYAPHRRGLPAIVDETTRALLHTCEEGLSVDEVIRLARSRDPAAPSDAALRVLIAACRALGFLADQPEPTRFQAAQPARTAISTLSVWLSLTSRCNLTCSYCFVEKTDRDMPEPVLERVEDAIVSTAVTRGAAEVDLRMGGGEPTLALPQLERAHERLRTRLEDAGIRLATRVVTNGTRVGGRLLAFLRRSGVSVSVSLDGYGPSHDYHRTFRGTARGSWTLVSENIDRLRDAGADVSIAATLSEESCVSLPRLLRWAVARSLPVHVQCVSEPKRPWNAAAPSADEYQAFNNRLIAALDGALLGLEQRLDRGEAVPEVTLDQLSVSEPQFGRCCGIGTSYVAITESGRVALCPTLARTGTAEISDDLIDAASTLLGDSPASRNGRDGDPCLACQWFPVCVGGCTAMNQRVNGDEFSVSPFCAFRRFAISRYVDYLGRQLLANARLQGTTQFRLLHSAPPGRPWSPPRPQEVQQ